MQRGDTLPDVGRITMVMRSLCFMLCLMLASGVCAQSEPDITALDSLLSQKHVYKCYDFAYNAQILIPAYFEQGQVDSIRVIIDFIRDRCGSHEFDRLSNLLDMYEGSFSQNLCDSAFIADLFGDNSFYWLNDMFRRRSWGLEGWSTETEAYAEFERSVIEALLADRPESSVERIYCLYCAGQYSLIQRELGQGMYEGTCLQDEYDSHIRELLARQYKSRYHLFFTGGVWSGLGANSFLGRKIELGGGAGLRRNRFGLDISLHFRVLNSPKDYQIVREGELKTTNHFFGGFVGLESAFEVLRLSDHQVELVGIGGWDGFDVVSSGDTEEKPTVGGIAYGYGLNYRLIYNRNPTYYLGLQARYTITNYNNSGGTDLSGNTISIRLVWGKMSNGVDWDLERLGHYSQ